MPYFTFYPRPQQQHDSNIQVTTAIYQESFKLTRLGEDSDRELTVLISYYKTTEQKQQSLLAFYLFSAPTYKVSLI